MPLEDHWVQAGEGCIYYRSNAHSPSSSRSVVVMVHGLVISSRYMVPTAEHLAPYAAVYALDLPGYGKSDKPAATLGLSQLADALAAWMDALGIGKAHFLGNSFGCQVLAEFALRHAQRIERLIFVGPTVDPAARSFWRQLFRLMRNSPNEPRSLGLISLRDYARAGLGRAWRTARIALEDRIETKLPGIGQPTLIVRGTKDSLVPQTWAEEACRLLPHGRLVVIPGCGHALNYSAPLELVRVVRPFLDL